MAETEGEAVARGLCKELEQEAYAAGCAIFDGSQADLIAGATNLLKLAAMIYSTMLIVESQRGKDIG